MHNLKGIIRTFTIILIIVCLIQLSFTWMARSVESKANAIAQQTVKVEIPAGASEADKLALEDSLDRGLAKARKNYLDTVGKKPIVNIWGLKEFLNYNFCRDNSLKLGLDLKGGMSVVLEINEDDVLRQLANNNKSAIFEQAIKDANAAKLTEQTDYLTVFKREFEKKNPDAKLAAIFASVDRYQGKLTLKSTNDEVINIIRDDFSNAIEQTFKVLKTRIDQFGVASPNISLQKSSGRILLELPGVEDPDRVRRLLLQTAQLEFWETYDNRELVVSMNRAYEAAKVLNAAPEKTETAVDTTASSSIVDSLSRAAGDTTGAAKQDTADKSKDISPLAKVLYPNADKDGRPGERPVVGYALGQDTAQVNRILALPAVRACFPADARLWWGMKPSRQSDAIYELYAIRVNPTTKEAPLSGKVITDAYQEHDAASGTFAVGLRMNNYGANKWEEMTAKAVDSKLPDGTRFKGAIAIVLDGRVLTAPTVQNKISGGSSQITGMDGINEANDLANILKSGKLSAKTKIIQDQEIGPSLGKESIKAGLFSIGFGILLVFLFMVAYYSTSGIIANAAMLLNLFFLVCALISFGAAFTLPAIAGIILTLAMAVDANVIINERVREEVVRGKGLRLAVDEGYQHSYSAIVDGNLTTMIAAIVLMIFGLGPIYGFGFTLFVGLLTSMFTAVLVSRLFFDWAFDRNMKISFGNSFTMNLFKHINFDFIGKRKISYTLSIIMFSVSIAGIIAMGFDLGVDFKGGRSYVVTVDKNTTTEQITKDLTGPLGSAPLVKTYGTANQFSITTAYLVDTAGAGIDSLVESKIYAGLKSYYNNDKSFDAFRAQNVKSSIKVEASIADDIRKSALWAIVFGIGGIFTYIFIRFRKVEYATGAVVATIHDPIIILGIFAIFKHIMPFSLEIDQNIVAAVLTLIGYSVNDTVVVFDRIREYVGLHPTRTLIQNTNDSINSTLSRTIMTVVTVFLVSLILFLFGGTPLRGFSFALIIGLLIGTYSSIFVASPIMVDMMNWRNKNKAAAK